jgi:hypothetical protein
MTLQEAPMLYMSCPTAVINAPVDVVWALVPVRNQTRAYR